MTWKEVGTYLDDYVLEISDIIVGVIAYAVIGVLYEHGDQTIFGIRYDYIGFRILLVSIALTLIIGVLLLRKNKRMSLILDESLEKDEKIQRLENDVDELYAEYSKLFNDQLVFMSKSLGFTANERISVYRHEINKFIIIGRYSINQKHNIIRVTQYPDDQGFISKAWLSELGDLYIHGLPPYAVGQKAKNPYYESIKKQCNIDAGRLEQMRMKSRNYYLKTLNDIGDTKRLAIIVFESIDENKLVKDKINTLIASEAQRITSFITKMRVEYRTQENATNAGV